MGFDAFEQFKNGVQGNGLRGHRHAGQTHARSQGAACSHAFAQMQFLGTQPHGVTKGVGVLQSALKNLCVLQSHFGLAETYATGFCQLNHFSQHFAF